MAEPGPSPVSRFELVSIALVLALFVVISLSVIGNNDAIGHDESVYALRAEAFNADQPPTDWHDYRAPGLPWLLQTAFVDSQPESEMRFIVVLFGLMVVLLTWVIGRQLFDRQVALLATLGVAMTPTVLHASTQIWPDIPGAAVSLVIIAIFLGATSGGRTRWWVLLIIPLAYWATILRFGAPIPIAVALTVVSVVRRKTVIRSWKLIASAALGTAAAVFSVLLFPDLTGSSGSPLAGFLELSDEKAMPRYQGLLDYWRLRDYLFGGPHGLVLGTGFALALIRKRPALSEGGKIALMVGVGAGIAIGLSVTGEPRYLSVVFPFLWIIAAAGISTILNEKDGIRLVTAFTAVSLLLAYSASHDDRISGSSRADNLLRSAAVRISEATGGENCGVITGYTPQVRWYSNCETAGYVTNRVVTDHSEFPPDGEVYLLWLENGKRQPDESVMNDYLEDSHLVFDSGTPGTSLRYLTVWLVTDD